MKGYFICGYEENNKGVFKLDPLTYKYKTGEIYENKITFYENLYDCNKLGLYGNRYFIIDTLGEVIHDIDNYSSTTNKFKIIEQIETMIMQMHYSDKYFNDHRFLKPKEGENVMNSGDIFHYKNGIVHSDGGLPAIIRKNGSEEYIVNGKHNREGDLPAKIFYKGDKCIYKAWYTNGLYNRENRLPAIIVYNKDGNIIEEHYYVNGKKHREDKLPAIIKWNNEGNVIEEEYFIDGIYNRDNNLPAYIKYDSDGNIIAYNYYDQGKCYKYMETYANQKIIYCEKNEEGNMVVHREEGLPAVIEKNGSKEYIVKGFKHREGDLPAIIKCNDGKVIEEHYYKNNKLNRDNGLPAIIIYDKDGIIIEKRFFINGVEQ